METRISGELLILAAPFCPTAYGQPPELGVPRE